MSMYTFFTEADQTLRVYSDDVNEGKTQIGKLRLLDLDQPGAYISQFNVTKKYRKSGFGTLLIETAIELAKQRGCTGLSLHCAVTNTMAINFYINHGFFICCSTTDRKNPHYMMAKQIINMENQPKEDLKTKITTKEYYDLTEKYRSLYVRFSGHNEVYYTLKTAFELSFKTF